MEGFRKQEKSETLLSKGGHAMPLRCIGPSLYRTGGTVFEPRVATFFPETGTLVTEGTTHWLNREAYCKDLQEQRRAAKLAPLTPEECTEKMFSGVDLIVQSDLVLIRPDPEQIERVLRADELLQRDVHKARIRFLLASNGKIFDTLTMRGELWRIASDAVTTQEMNARTRNTRMKLEGRAIYYHSPPTGTRYLTLNEFRLLAHLNVTELRQHLLEIQKYCQLRNKQYAYELDFFQGGPALRTAVVEAKFPAADEAALRAEHVRLCGLFEETVPARLRSDDPLVPEWQEEMYDTLYPLAEHAAEPEEKLGLGKEFRKHIKWLPGGRMKRGHVDFDSIFDHGTPAELADVNRHENRRARAIILNFVRDYGDLEYINVGWINESLSRAHRAERGHRDVYVVAMKRASEQQEQVHMLRIQKWDMTFRLDHGKSPEAAMFETEEYMEYTQDRYLGCRRLGLNLFGPVRTGKISELYEGTNAGFKGTPIWTPYFARSYVPGIATDTIGKDRLHRPGYADRFAELLGQAAASNLIVGRGDGATEGFPDEELIVFFDDGDEVLVERDGLVEGLIVMHHTGSFWHYEQALCRFAHAYARPVIRRMKDKELPDPRAFARIYLDSLMARFTAIQDEYREEPRAFDNLFSLRHVRQDGNFAHRWNCVLKRLRMTDPAQLRDCLARHLQPALEEGTPQ